MESDHFEEGTKKSIFTEKHKLWKHRNFLKILCGTNGKLNQNKNAILIHCWRWSICRNQVLLNSDCTDLGKRFILDVQF